MMKFTYNTLYLYTFLLLLVVPHLTTVFSWKKEEFRSCNQTPFCKRARSRKPGSCNLIATDVLISDGDLKAKLVPKNQGNEEETQIEENKEKEETSSNPLILSLSVYSDGILRLKIDEDPSLDPPKKRFEVPDVIEAEILEKKLWLQRVVKEDGLNVVYLNDEYEAVLRNDPFEIFVRGKDKKIVMSLNSHGLFDFEQLRVKKEGEDWEERFKGHTDKRPYGPQSISFDVSFYDVSFVYGIPEHATTLALKPTRGPGVEESEPYRLFNLDVFEYLHESPFGLYGSIPFMLGHGKARGTSGFFWLNAAEMQIDVLKDGWDAESSIALPSSQKRIDTFWMSEAGIVDAFFFVGPGPKDVVRQYTSVTGRSALPQLFATAYHQCRWNYRDEEDVQNVDSKFDEHDIPYDVIWLDIDHTDGKRYFTWDKALFPNPEEMQKKLAAKGRKLVTIVDPHIKRDNSYHIHKEATEKGYYVKDSNGNDFDGRSYGYGLRGELNTSSFLTDAQADLHKPSLVSPNSYLNGPSTPTHNNGGSSPSQYRNLGSPNSSFSNYALNGYTINPGSPSMLGNQLGNSSLPPLFENVAAATAMGVSGMDSRRMGGLALGPNLIAAAAELQNMSRVGNQNAVNGLQIPFVDPSYLQYLQSTEFAAAQVAALNKQTMESESLINYMELAGLQKSYLGGALSPQKSQYGLPYLGKSANLTHGYYGNQAFGLGMSYPGTPLGSALLPNSPIGNGSPIRNVDRSLHFPSGMRNFGGGIMGPWHSETGGMLAENFASSLLDEFKNNKTRCFELSEIAGHVVEFSADQYGSRFIQQKLETATTEEKNMVFNEIMPQSLSLMTDVFGNYVIQKFFEHGSTSQIRELADQLNGHVLNLSLQMYGCRVIQKAIEVVELDQQTNMVAELDGHIMRCVRDQNGNHVIQKCIECIPEDAIQFIISIFYDQVVTLSTHPYGCRVIQRVLEHCSDQKTQQIVMDEIMRSVCMLAQDQYGNYVVQHVLEHGKPHERTCIINKLIGKIVQMSQQKFASNVVEKCLTFGTPEERQCLVDEMLGTTDENEPLQAMMKDQFANYVVQKVLETCDDQQLELILNRIKVHLNALKKYTYGKHIVARVEKLVAAGERRIGVLASYSAAAAAAAAAAT